MICFFTLIDTETGRCKFGRTYERYRSLIYFCAYQVLENEQDAEDATQNVFLYIAKRIDTFPDAPSDLCKGLVMLTARHKAVDLYRQRTKRQHFSLDEQIDATNRQIADPQSQTENNVLDILGQMNERYRDVLIRRVGYGYEFSEIAEQLSITEANARKLLQRARKQFVKLYEERGRDR